MPSEYTQDSRFKAVFTATPASLVRSVSVPPESAPRRARGVATGADTARADTDGSSGSWLSVGSNTGVPGLGLTQPQPLGLQPATGPLACDSPGFVFDQLGVGPPVCDGLVVGPDA